MLEISWRCSGSNFVPTSTKHHGSRWCGWSDLSLLFTSICDTSACSQLDIKQTCLLVSVSFMCIHLGKKETVSSFAVRLFRENIELSSIQMRSKSKYYLLNKLMMRRAAGLSYVQCFYIAGHCSPQLLFWYRYLQVFRMPLYWTLVLQSIYPDTIHMLTHYIADILRFWSSYHHPWPIWWWADEGFVELVNTLWHIGLLEADEDKIRKIRPKGTLVTILYVPREPTCP